MRKLNTDTFTESAFGSSSNKNRDHPMCTEWKIAVYGLIISLLIFSTRFFTIYGNIIETAFLEEKLIRYQVWSEDGQQMFMASWKHVVKYSNIWLPILCGMLTTYFTWIMVYLDSEVPGVQPPSPFSPTKFKSRSGHTFHLNYVFAVLIGFLVTGYMYFREISIIY